MIVSVTITLSVPAGEKHRRQMRQAAQALTNAKRSVQVLETDSDLNKLTARFTIPRARQQDIVDHIGRRFWDIEDYADSSIGFGSEE